MSKLTFEEWMQKVNEDLVRLCSMGSDDLPDWRYRDDYDDGMTPLRSALRAIKYAQES